MATVGLARAVQPLCSLRQSLQGSLFAVRHVYIKNPRHSHRQTYGSLFSGPRSCENGCKRKFHTLYSFYVYLVLGGRGLIIASMDWRYRSARPYTVRVRHSFSKTLSTTSEDVRSCSRFPLRGLTSMWRPGFLPSLVSVVSGKMKN